MMFVDRFALFELYDFDVLLRLFCVRGTVEVLLFLLIFKRRLRLVDDDGVFWLFIRLCSLA
jgi:hypothetical protein